MSRRRSLLKVCSVAGGAVVANNWTKPIVNSVSLPAHATATPTATSSTCSGQATALGIEGVDADLDNINIIIGEGCALTVTESKSTDPDTVISLDLDATGSGAGTWDNEGPGANWTISPNGGSDQPGGSYAFSATRQSGPDAGSVYLLQFDVDIQQVASDPDQFEMTVSNVQFALD